MSGRLSKGWAEKEWHKEKYGFGQSDRGSSISSQADDNLALTFLRHLQSRFNLKHNNQFSDHPENIKHVWYLQPSTRSWTAVCGASCYTDCLAPENREEGTGSRPLRGPDWNDTSKGDLWDYKAAGHIYETVLGCL